MFALGPTTRLAVAETAKARPHRVSTCSVARNEQHPTEPVARRPRYKRQASCRSFAGSLPKIERCGPEACLGPVPTWPEFDDTTQHLRYVSFAAASDTAG